MNEALVWQVLGEDKTDWSADAVSPSSYRATCLSGMRIFPTPCEGVSLLSSRSVVV